VVKCTVDNSRSPHLCIEMELFSPSVYDVSVITRRFNFIERTTRSFNCRFYMLSKSLFITVVIIIDNLKGLDFSLEDVRIKLIFLNTEIVF
jgi:hypothetical protein